MKSARIGMGGFSLLCLLLIGYRFLSIDYWVSKPGPTERLATR